MNLNLGSLMEQVNKLAVPEEEIEERELAMRLIEWVCYSSKTQFGEIDFNSFPLEAAKRAFHELVAYCADDSGGDEEENKGNLLLEINRIAHLKQSVNKLRSPKKRRFF